jgi:8-oxo-dGTP pyrophosphatase MutT (NUDIX family)
MCRIVFSVKGLVLVKNKILLLRRAPFDRYCPNYWELPGGKVKTLNFKNDFIREAEEESGLKVVKVNYRGVLFKKSALYKDIFSWPNLHCTFFVSASCIEQTIILSGEHSGFIWLKPENSKYLVLTAETKYALGKYCQTG